MSDPATGPAHQGLGVFEPPGLDAATPPVVAQGSGRRPRWPGGLAGGIAILMVLSWACGLAAISAGFFEIGVGLSVSAVLLSGLAVLAGLVAVIGRWGRAWGVAAVLVGVLLNPVVLTLLLGWVGAL